MLWETVKLALRTLRGQKFRTFLTMLSVTIGAFSIVVMLSLAQSGHRTLSRSVEELGGMRLVLWIPNFADLTSRDRSVYNRGFTEDDLDRMKDLPHLELIAAQGVYPKSAVYHTADRVEKPDIVGVAAGLLEGMGWSPSAGRLITERDNNHRDRVVVLTSDMADYLFEGEQALGNTITVLQKPYQVVGVLQKRDMLGVSFGFSWDKSVFIPLGTAEIREGQPKEAKFLVGFTDDPSNNPTVVDMANAVLLANHRGVEDFQSMDFSEVLSQFYEFFTILDLIVFFIASVSLFAGGIGVMNIMLVSVSERVREIGIRKAVGASVPNIMSQFLIEATTLSLTGGLIGVGLGLGVTFIAHKVIVRSVETWVGTYSFWGVGLSLATTAVIGLVFGAVPAYRAAKLEIVDCLRSR